ncbi:ComEA family DNA-binding protein [Delftia tsuruhatensis]|uniref:ComEA family DNA-binding protein n=1 Tax=Delftia tsuruhatensis TaxID=180282 RepID=UPI003AF01E3D
MTGLFALLLSALAFAAVDVNKATEAELTTIKGIGPAMSARILAERKSSSFKDWPDFIERVKGVGESTATKFSAEGLTVNGSGYKNKAGKPAAKDAKDARSVPPAKEQAAKPAAPAKSGNAS